MGAGAGAAVGPRSLGALHEDDLLDASETAGSELAGSRGRALESGLGESGDGGKEGVARRAGGIVGRAQRAMTHTGVHPEAALD